MQNTMKKIMLFLALIVLLVACSKEQITRNTPVVPKSKVSYFSRVQYFKDNRTPSTDTIWTLQLFNQQMVDSFAKWNGKVYWESTIAKEVGVLWSK